MRKLFYDISGSDKWERIDFVDRGWSDDKKYHIVTNEGRHHLLRISKKETFELKKHEFKIIQNLSVLDFEMTKAYDFGICSEGVYMLLGWIEGDDLEKVIATMNFLEQYKLGYEAGKILKSIHEFNIEFEPFDWEVRFIKKIDKNIQMYEDCPLKYDNGHLFVEYVNNSKKLLANRPLSLHHGDFHIGNMIYSKAGQIGIIDFNRFNFGDPWEEFNRIVWDIQNSHAFATGRVDGYFDENIPDEFFGLMALYVTSNTLSSLPWAIPFGDEEVLIMRNQAKNILQDYDNFQCIIPKWYLETKEKLKASSIEY